MSETAKAILREDAIPSLVAWVEKTEAAGNGIWVTGSQGEVAFQIIDEPGDPIALIVYPADRDFEVANWVLEVAG